MGPEIHWPSAIGGFQIGAVAIFIVCAVSAFLDARAEEREGWSREDD